MHSNISFGNVFKVNLYNRMVDKLQINQSQRPIELPKICDKIFKALDYYSDREKLHSALKNIRNDVRNNVDELLGNITHIEDDTIPLVPSFFSV